MTNLQFLMVVVLVFVALVCVLVLVWSTHSKRQTKKQITHEAYKLHVEDSKVFSEIDMTQIEQFARQQLQQSTIKAAEELHSTLTNTVEQISTHLNELVNKDLNQEFEKYRVSLEALRNQSVGEFAKLEKELSAKRIEQFDQLDKDVAAEYNRRIEQFNVRLGDVVSSYLLEALGNKVDLGAQSSYIFDVLNEHKEDIKKDVMV